MRGIFSSYVRDYNHERSNLSIGYVSPMEYELKNRVKKWRAHKRVRFRKEYAQHELFTGQSGTLHVVS